MATIDRFSRAWDLPATELCPDCGQPDSCGDCNHEPLTAAEVTSLGGRPASWKPEVIADRSGKWVGNALRFATKEEAEANVRNLAARWVLVRDTRVVESDEPVNYAWRNGTLVAVDSVPG